MNKTNFYGLLLLKLGLLTKEQHESLKQMQKKKPV
ncbi:hypothetical protein ABMB67_000154 [Halalkalibacter oceani]